MKAAQFTRIDPDPAVLEALEAASEGPLDPSSPWEARRKVIDAGYQAAKSDEGTLRDRVSVSEVVAIRQWARTLGEDALAYAAGKLVTDPSLGDNARRVATGGKPLQWRTLTQEFKPATAPVKVAFFDADSTLRVAPSGSVSANGEKDVMLLPFVADKLRALVEEGYLIAIVSNQAGVAGGHVRLSNADAALQYSADLIRAAGGDVHYVDFAPARDNDRKPNPGMYDRLERTLKKRFGDDYSIDKEASFMVGDSAYKKSDTRPDGTPGTDFSNSDRGFAESAGIPFHEPDTFFGWDHYGVDRFHKVEHVQEFWQRLRMEAEEIDIEE